MTCAFPSSCRALLAASVVALSSTAVLLASTAVLSADSQGEDRPRWFGSSYDRTTVFAYGVPDSDDVILNFSCRPGASAVKVDVQEEESGAKTDKPLHVRMAAGGASVTFSDKGVVNQDSGGLELHAELPLDETLRRILTSEKALEVTVAGRMRRYAMDGTTALAAKMIATCDSPKPADDLDVTVINKARLPLQSFAYSQAGVNSFDGGEFGNRSLAPGASRTVTIPDGRKICTFDISVVLAKDDAECCEEPKPAGTRNLCKNGEFVVRD